MRGRLRVIGGVAGSVPLIGPPAGVRPTTDRVREALFNSIAIEVAEGPFVDLFAGSGAVGIEALSRGAKRALFIEKKRNCVKVIRENLRKVGFENLGEVVQGDVYKLRDKIVEWLRGEAGIIFADPPYKDQRWAELVKWLLEAAELAPGTVIIVEHSRRYDLSHVLPQPVWQKKIGETLLSRWEKK